MSKELVKKIIQRLNTVPIGIKFNFEPDEKREGPTYSEPVNYCEVVYKAMRTGKPLFSTTTVYHARQQGRFLELKMKNYRISRIILER
jgi:uncharacterized protein (DUF169 family)